MPLATPRTVLAFVAGVAAAGSVPFLASGPASEPALAPALAQEIDGYAPTVEALLDEALAHGGAYERLSRLVEVAPHRLSGSPGLAAAIEWARQELLDVGFDEVRLEPVEVPCWVRGDTERLAFEAPRHLAGEALPVLALGGSVATAPGGVAGEIVALGSWEELAQRAAEVRGNIAYFNRPMDPTARNVFDAYGNTVDQRSRGPVEAAKAGAVAVIIRSVGIEIDGFPHTGATRYQDGVPRIPAAAVSTRDAERLDALLQQGPVRLRLELDCEWREPQPSFNVVGDYRGSELPDEIVVVGGHLDGWDVGQGAHDDGAGCAHATEVVRLWKRLDLRPKRTLRCVLFTNEENGLAGGREYARAHAEELDRHVLALESDAGGFTPRGFATNANEEAFALLERVVALLDSASCARLEPGGGGADISQMAGSGVPLVGFRPDDERYFDYHHTHSDTLDKVSRRELDLGAGAIAALLYVVADLSVAPARNPTPSSR